MDLTSATAQSHDPPRPELNLNPLPPPPPLSSKPDAPAAAAAAAATTADRHHSPAAPAPKSLSRKRPSKPASTLYEATLRSPRHHYFHLQILLPSSPPATAPTATFDAVPLRRALLSSLASHLGDFGAAIPLDILQVRGLEAWVRAPREDGKAVLVALGASAGLGGAGAVRATGVEGFRVVASGAWLGALTGRQRQRQRQSQRGREVAGKGGGYDDGDGGLFDFSRPPSPPPPPSAAES